jgi:glycerol-3-phosphate dehydrogenase (NAD(P)+)
LNVLKPLKSSSQQTQIAILGSGSWATALAKIFTDAQNHVHWYVRDQEQAEAIRQKSRNPTYLSSVRFRSRNITVSSDIKSVIRTCDWIVLAIPSTFLDATLKQIDLSFYEKRIISGVKGIVPESKYIVREHLNKHYNLPSEQFLVIAGPSHAEEIALERLSFLTLACSKKSSAEQLKKLMLTKYVRAKTSNDVVGIEYAATLKNVYSLAVGIAHGLNYGDNFQSVLISNAIREMNRFLKKISESSRNINQSAYLGDLLVTACSPFSRNSLFGNMIGRGASIKSAQLEMKMIAEGYYACLSVYELSQKNGVNTPILDTIYLILYRHKNPKKVFRRLVEKLN